MYKAFYNSVRPFITGLKFTAIILILILISIELSNFGLNHKSYTKLFNLNFFFLSIIFLMISQIFGAYVFFIFFQFVSKIKLLYFFRITAYGNFLNYFPFIGTIYKGLLLKKKYKISYTNYLSSYFITNLIGLINLLFLLTLFFLIPFNQNIILNKNIYYIIIFLFLFIIFVLFFLKKIYLLIKKIKFKKIIINKKNINKISNLFIKILIKVLKNKHFLFKSLYFDLFANIFNFFSFYFIFKIYAVNIELFTLICIYLLFSISTLIKVLPKNYFVNEFIGAYLVGLGLDNFFLGLLIMLSLRVVSLIVALNFFIILCIKDFFDFHKIKISL